MARIAILPGDGIGPEEMYSSLPILRYVASARKHKIELVKGLIGWSAYDVFGDVMPDETWAICEKCDAILLGAVGLPDRDKTLPREKRPERRALLPLRKHFGLGCNVRPIKVYPQMEYLSPLKKELVEGLEIFFYRELLSGDYFGERICDPNGDWAQDSSRYTRSEIELVAREAFMFARQTGKKVTSIDKANVKGAEGSFWREKVQDLHDREFPDVNLEHNYIDAQHLYLFTKPKEYQIVLASNGFGDHLSDAGGGIVGSMGLVPSISYNPNTRFALYEPAGGSAPDIAGTGTANPIAMILSIALLFKYTFSDAVAAKAIEDAVKKVLAEGCKTRDLMPTNCRDACRCGTDLMAEMILNRLQC